MGGRSSDDSDEERHSESRKRNNRHLRSRSRSRERRKDKKSKTSRHRRTRSRSPSSGRRSRSAESNSRHRGHRRSRSRSRSGSRPRRSDHRDSRSHHSRSYKKSNNSSRESSRSRDTMRTHTNGAASDRSRADSADRTHNAVPTSLQQENKLQLAIRAAAAADDILRAQGVVIGSAGARVKTETSSFDEQQRRASAINDIDKNDFVQASFKSSRTEIPLPTGSSVDASHTGAMFGTSHSKPTPLPKTERTGTAAATALNGDSLMHPNLYVSTEEKMERWKIRLAELRRTKLQSRTVIQ